MDSNWTLSFGATKSMHAEKSEVIGREKPHKFHGHRVSLGSIWAFQIHVPPYAPEVILFMHMQNKSLIEHTSDLTQLTKKYTSRNITPL